MNNVKSTPKVNYDKNYKEIKEKLKSDPKLKDKCLEAFNNEVLSNDSTFWGFVPSEQNKILGLNIFGSEARPSVLAVKTFDVSTWFQSRLTKSQVFAMCMYHSKRLGRSTKINKMIEDIVERFNDIKPEKFPQITESDVKKYVLEFNNMTKSDPIKQQSWVSQKIGLQDHSILHTRIQNEVVQKLRQQNTDKISKIKTQQDNCISQLAQQPGGNDDEVQKFTEKANMLITVLNNLNNNNPVKCKNILDDLKELQKFKKENNSGKIKILDKSFSHTTDLRLTQADLNRGTEVNIVKGEKKLELRKDSLDNVGNIRQELFENDLLKDSKVKNVLAILSQCVYNNPIHTDYKMTAVQIIASFGNILYSRLDGSDDVKNKLGVRYSNSFQKCQITYNVGNNIINISLKDNTYYIDGTMTQATYTSDVTVTQILGDKVITKLNSYTFEVKLNNDSILKTEVTH